jgi:hypothetical protein
MRTAQTIVIDQECVHKTSLHGFPKPFILQSLNAGELNHATTCYYLQ